MLKDKISQYGLEVEYPISGDSYNVFGEEIHNRYHIHHDGGGLEFTTPKPLPFDEIIDQVDKIYDLCETAIKDKKVTVHKSYYDNHDTGTHIRIDISSWDQIERLRFLRLFSTDMEKYPDFIKWMAQNFRRDWHAYNAPCSYSNGYYPLVRNNRSSEKFINAKYEVSRYGRGVDTIEIRAFAVPQNRQRMKDMFTFIHILCDIVDKSITDTSEDAIPYKLYRAWSELVNHIAVPISSIASNDRVVQSEQ